MDKNSLQKVQKRVLGLVATKYPPVLSERRPVSGLTWLRRRNVKKKAGESTTGQKLAGGRQKTKDLYDVFFLSKNVQALSVWFPRHSDFQAYERLAAWYLGIPKSKTVIELLELVPGCDTKLLFKHLDDEIIGKLNKRYSGV